MAKKTELTTDVVVQQYPILAPGSDLAETMQANMRPGDEIDETVLPRITTPTGGGKVWQPEGEDPVDEITGLLVYFCPRGVLWPSLEPEEGTLPVLVSHDLRTARLVRAESDVPPEMLETLKRFEIEPGIFKWSELPYCQFGSGKDGSGKWAKEQRVLFVLRPGAVWPSVVAAGPGSLKSVRPFLMTGMTVPHWRCIVSLTLQQEKSASGIKFSRIIPRVVGTIDREQGEVIRQTYTEPLRRLASQVDVDVSE